MRWERVVKPGKEGVELPAFLEGSRREMEERIGGGRHSAVLSIGWDRWEEGTRELVERGIRERPVSKRKVKTVDFGDRDRN